MLLLDNKCFTIIINYLRVISEFQQIKLELEEEKIFRKNLKTAIKQHMSNMTD